MLQNKKWKVPTRVKKTSLGQASQGTFYSVTAVAMSINSFPKDIFVHFFVRSQNPCSAKLFAYPSHPVILSMKSNKEILELYVVVKWIFPAFLFILSGFTPQS